jgi:CBS domain-containing protein
MAEVACGSALVLSAGAVVGIITERDILAKIVAKSIDPAKTSVESVMTKDPVCARPEMSVPHALFIMKELGFRHLPVVDDDHIPLGVFALRDALPDELAGAAVLIRSAEQLAATLR